MVKDFNGWVNESKSKKSEYSDLSFEDLMAIYDLGVIDKSYIKVGVAKLLLEELERRNMGHTLLSNETQLNNGNVFFEFSGKAAKPIIDAAFAEYKFDETDLIENFMGYNFWDKVNTGTKYQLSGEGFMKHNTGPSKVEFELSRQGITKIVDHVIANAKNYLIRYAISEGYFSKITEKPTFKEGSVELSTILRYLNSCEYGLSDKHKDSATTKQHAIDTINLIHNTRPDWYNRISGQLLAFLIAVVATRSRITIADFWVNRYRLIAVNPDNRNYYFDFILDFVAVVKKSKKSFSSSLQLQNVLHNTRYNKEYETLIKEVLSGKQSDDMIGKFKNRINSINQSLGLELLR